MKRHHARAAAVTISETAVSAISFANQAYASGAVMQPPNVERMPHSQGKNALSMYVVASMATVVQLKNSAK
jgi:hypothetical protein